MKRNYYILLFLLIAMPFAAKAQIGELRYKFAVGVNGGVNMNNVTFSPKIKQNSFLAPNAGVTFRFISEKYFAMICGIQTEINFSQRGWNENFDDESGDIYKRTLNYVEIPFLSHLAFGKDNGTQFFIHLGPQIGFLLNEKEEMTFTKERESVLYKKPVENKFDYGITGGLGLDVNTKIGHFILEGRYYFALSDFYGNSPKDPFGRSAHNTILAKFTYLFDLKK